jgi:hypothetical protein
MKASEKYAWNMSVAMQLHEAGVQMMRQNIARRLPNAGSTTLNAEVRRWLRREGDAIPGDVDGPVRIRTRSA